MTGTLSKAERKALRRAAKKEKLEQREQRDAEKKKVKKPKTETEQPEDVEGEAIEVNPEFTFETDGGSFRKASSSWDFSAAKEAITKGSTVTAQRAETSVDDKIKRKRKRGAADEDAEDVDVDEDGEDEGDRGVDSEDGDDDADERVEMEDETTALSGTDDDDVEDTVKDKRRAEFFAEAPDAENDDIGTFTDMRLSRPLLKAIAELGFVKPTTIQAKGIPIALQGIDLCAAAVTGSGKTAAFIVPVLERLLHRPKHVPCSRVLVLVPTRELGVQCHSVAVSLAKFTDIQLCLCVGGLSSKLQEVELKRRPDVIIATPGRLIDHIQNSPSFNLDTIEILIIDEADRILDDGFADELNEIIKSTPKNRQTMLFSATMTDNVDDLIKLSLNRPVRLFVDKNTAIASRLVQEFVRVRNTKEESRPAILASLCSRIYKHETIIFFRSKAAAHHMKIIFGLLGFKAAELHGNLTQLQRLEALESFRDKQVDFLLATDLASRGLDISGIKTVINFDMPKSYTQYVHRVGRTARGDKAGKAVSLVGEADRKLLKLAIKGSTGDVKNRIIPPEHIAKYEKKIAGLEKAIKEIYEEEKSEKDIKNAEMKVRKMENLILHKDEIQSRPAKTWFQSSAERDAAKELGRLENAGTKASKKATVADAKDKPKRGKMDGLSRKKKRLRMAREEDKAEIAAVKVAARSAKKAYRGAAGG
ncbi:nucleolar DEAD-box protein required for synthesis of 60S ribosomal subunit, partial [Irineochytrium annulatum]